MRKQYVIHQWHKKSEYLSIDAVSDFRELTEFKLAAKDAGVIMVFGGVPKNFTQDIVVATDILGEGGSKVWTDGIGEASITFPLIISDAYHRGAWKERNPAKLSNLFATFEDADGR